VAKEASINDFGLLIAYVLPGFTALWGGTYLSGALRPWFGLTPADAPTVGGFLYLTIASVAAGLTVSTVRWLLIDTLHHRTGLPPPPRDFSRLGTNVLAFQAIVEDQYRYYQNASNMFLALGWVFVARRWALGFWDAPLGPTDLGLLLLEVVFFLGSRDTLAKYYARTGQLLGATPAHLPPQPPVPEAVRSEKPRTGRARKRRALPT
jgi:hypothetical protein